MTEQTQENAVSKEDLWRLDNYILLKDYLDRTISRIAARCVRSGNIAIEEYPFYDYILDVLEEICETGEYVLEHPQLLPYVEKKIPGGIEELKKRLMEFKMELKNNSSPDMIKADEDEVSRAKAIFGAPAFDPTKGAGMSMDDVVAKLAEEHNREVEENQESETEE